MNCPICSHELIPTETINLVFNFENFYCEECHSYHILEKFNDLEYYSKKYHKAFNYKKILSKVTKGLGLVSNRCLARYKYINNQVNLKSKLNYLEIGGGTGENFIIYNYNKNPKTYTIIEPNSGFNIKDKKLRYFNDIFENIAQNELADTDIILMFHVLEHIYDLKLFLNKIHELKPNYFYFEIPNIDNPVVLEDSLKNHPHYHHFSIKSIEYLLPQYKFEKIVLEGIEPNSYHPYKKVGKFKRYFLRFFNKHEEVNNKGLYIRGLFKIKE